MSLLVLLVLSAPCFAGLALGSFMSGVMTRRKRVVKESGKNGEMKITVARSLRCELVFLSIHVILCASAMLAIYERRPGVEFFAVRGMISTLLCYCSVKDLSDRRRLEAYFKPGKLN